MTGIRLLAMAMLMLELLLASGAHTASAAAPDVQIPGDDASVRRGAEMVTTLCMNCHSLKYIHYRNLLQLGVRRDTLDLWKGDKNLNSPLLGQMPADMARASFGKVPPDLSLITSAREGGGHYVYALLTGFYSAEDGTTDNHAFAGITMPDVLGYSFAGSAAGRRQIERTAADVAAFLEWAAEPSAGFRVKLGGAVILYLVVLTTLLFLWKRRIWKGIDHGIGHTIGGS